MGNHAGYADLAGRVAVVTGGSRGIGAETARLLAADAVRVVVVGRDQAAIDRVVTEIVEGGGTAVGVAADVTDADALAELRGHTESAFGPADILVAFAGGYSGRPRPLVELSEREWRSLIDLNLTSAFLTLREFLPGMIERRRGSAVLMSSTAGRMATMATLGGYAAAKAGVQMLTRQAAMESGRYGVRVNCVAPSAIITERNKDTTSELTRQRIAALHPLGRLGVPRDVAAVTAFLASDAASWLTGLTVDVAGGRVMM